MGEERRDPVRPQFTDHCFTGDYPSAALTDAASADAASAATALAAGGGELSTAASSAGVLAEARIALVTGASRGIGAATGAGARQGAAAPMWPAVARTVGGLEELDDAIRAAGGAGATLVPLDGVTDAEGWPASPAALGERYRPASTS